MNQKLIDLQGWGRTACATVTANRIERSDDIGRAICAQDDSPIIACGKGRSYGDVFLNDRKRVLLMSRLNRLLDLDSEKDILVCESGVSYAKLLDVLPERGYFPQVTPGTSFVSMGGALANDVHGKNSDMAGSFGDHIHWFNLVLASGETVRVSAESDPELFAATIGGIGLTGVVTDIALSLKRIPSSFLSVREERQSDLETFMGALEESRSRDYFSVGWIDGMARGHSMGRGILETANFVPPDAGTLKPFRTFRIPFNLPSSSLNPLSVNMFNKAYYHRIPKHGRTTIKHMRDFFYPLDRLHDWNRIYGRRGFYQFNCVIPDAGAKLGMRKLLEKISDTQSTSFLAVIKTMGGKGRGYLSFPMKGYTLALDFPRRTGTEELISSLTEIAIDHGGRIYLAKDNLLSATQFQRMYTELPKLRTVLERVDPSGRFGSDMSRRLGVR
jgi:decaprenylphospho-beta-D-ribofuranose 2-oxidase